MTHGHGHVTCRPPSLAALRGARWREVSTASVSAPRVASARVATELKEIMHIHIWHPLVVCRSFFGHQHGRTASLQARPAALPAPTSPSSSTAPTALIAVAHLMRHRAPPGAGGSDPSAPRTAPLSAEATYAATLRGSANSPASGRQTGTIAKLPGRQPVTMAPSDLGEARAGATTETPLTGCMALELGRTS